MSINVFEVVGGAINGVCELGARLIDGVVGPDGVFAKTLEAVSAANPFASPGLPPGERVSELEAHLIQLERMIQERRGMLAQEGSVLDVSTQLTEIAKVLDDAPLTTSEREAAFAKIVAFLSNRGIAQRLGTTAPDEGQFLEDLNNLLDGFDLQESQVRGIMQQVTDVFNGVEEKTAA